MPAAATAMHVALLTSGGDAPGMNAAIRAITKASIARGHRVSGILRGYEGLLAGDVRPLALSDVDGISRHGGTILGSARSAEFPTPDGQARARDRVRALGVDALVVIGGNGSLTGAHALATVDPPCTVVGLPASIDNDVGCTHLAIGVDTAVNTIVEACDRISDTATAHRRAFVVEVMGRRCGYLAMRAGVAADADAILFSEDAADEDATIARLRDLLRRSFAPERGKRRVLIVKAEGVPIPTSRIVARLSEALAEDAPGIDVRETILGHVVRGGSPSALDRLIAQRLGTAAVVAAAEGRRTDVMLAWEGGAGAATSDPSVREVPLADVLHETARMLDGSSEPTRRRIEMLRRAEKLLAL
jgi:6-phosphofructokinase 1